MKLIENTIKNKQTKIKERKKLFLESFDYKIIKETKVLMENYYLDSIISLFPVVGDFLAQTFNFSFLYISMFKLKSYRLTMVILLNSLIDILLGIIPYAGIVLDFLYRSYKENFDLVVGFVEEDPVVIKKINQRALWSTIGVIVVFLLIIAIIWLFYNIISSIWQFLFGLVQ